MVITDSTNGLVVRRLYLTAAGRTSQSGCIMTLTVIGLAYGIGVIKLLQPTSFALPLTDAVLTLIVLGAVLLAFAIALMRSQRTVFS